MLRFALSSLNSSGVATKLALKLCPIGFAFCHLQVSVAIGQRAGIAFSQNFEVGLQRQVMQVGAQFAFAIVVVNLTAFQQKMANAEIEYARLV